MSGTRLSYQVMSLGVTAQTVANHLQRADDIWAEVKAARDKLMRCSADLQAIVCDLDRMTGVDGAIRGRVWSAWQRTEAAVKYADDAVMLLNADAHDAIALASEHRVTPFRSEQRTDGEEAT